MRDYLVYFTDNSAFVTFDEKKIKELIGNPHALLNPEIGRASNYRPYYWKPDKANNRVTVMNALERKVRQAHLRKNGLQTKPRKVMWYHVALPVLKAAIVSLGVVYIFHQFVR